MNDGLLSTSWEIWDYLIEKAGLDLKNYDRDIIEKLCELLNISSKNIRKELQKRNIPPESFIGAFLKVIQPYALMVYDLYFFFYLYGVKKTNKDMKILFDFGKGPEDLGFDLKHFREILHKYEKISKCITIYGWNHNTLWQLAGIFRDFWEHEPLDDNAIKWLNDYKDGKFNLPLPILPKTEIEEFDLWLEEVWQIFATIIYEFRKYGSTSNDLKNAYSKTYSNINNNIENMDEYYRMPNSLELFSFREWDVETLFILNSDKWPEKMLRGLFGFIERFKISKNNNNEDRLIQNIKQLFSNIPKLEIEREELISEFLELLNLPIWKRRYELYQTWVLTQIDKALEDYQKTIHHVNGSLILRFSGTHVGTIETEKGRIHIWSELRSPLSNPVGVGRKRNIQPDYSLTFEPVTDPSQTVVVIECKQYHKTKTKNFVDVLIDYSKGRPNALVCLVNYGKIPSSILNNVNNDLKRRILLIENFRPLTQEKFVLLEPFEKFKNALLQYIPKPNSILVANAKLQELQFDLIAVDISGSMESVLDEENVRRILHMIVCSSPNAKLLAIDKKIRKEWPMAKNALEELLNLPRNNGTDLPNSLSNKDLTNAVVITDEDGWEQLSRMDIRLVIEIRYKNANIIYFHFKEE